MRKKALLQMSVAAVAASMIVGSAQASVIYSDTFSRVTGSGDANGDPNGAADNYSDWGTNDNGLGGTTAQAWVAGPSRAGGGRNAVTDGNVGISFGTSSFFDNDVTTVAPDGFTVAMDFSRTTGTESDGGYIAIGLGVDAGSVMAGDFHAIGASDWSILFQQANNGNAANAAISVDGVTGPNFDYLDPLAAHTLLLTVTPAVSGAYGDTDSITVDVLVDGTIANSYTTTGGANFGSLTVSANNFTPRYIDNLVVTAVPEPASLALMGLGGLMMLRRR